MNVPSSVCIDQKQNKIQQKSRRKWKLDLCSNWHLRMTISWDIFPIREWKFNLLVWRRISWLPAVGSINNDCLYYVRINAVADRINFSCHAIEIPKCCLLLLFENSKMMLHMNERTHRWYCHTTILRRTYQSTVKQRTRHFSQFMCIFCVKTLLQLACSSNSISSSIAQKKNK